MKKKKDSKMKDLLNAKGDVNMGTWTAKSGKQPKHGLGAIKPEEVKAKVPHENKIIKEKKESDNKAKQTEIIVLLDRSGSMKKISAQTVEGFNTFLNEQKNSEGEAFITLIQFDDRYEVDYKSIPVKEASDLILNETYVPRGSTALYESIGKTINELNTDRDVVFVIITDGQDNVKSEYKVEAIKKMITTLQDDNGYKFLFLAANQDAFAEGGKLGVSMRNSVSYAASGAGVTNVFQAMSSNIGSYRKSKKDLFSTGTVDFMAQASGSLGFSELQRKDSMDNSAVIKETTKETIVTKETTKETKEKK
jgi:hypothetical protein